MSDPYRSLPEKEFFQPDAEASKRIRELERDVASLTKKNEELAAVADRYRQIVLLNDETRAQEKKEWAELLSAYQSKHGGVDLVASRAVELQQIKYAYQAALERIRDLERHYR
jgi:hypothetical protein